MLHAAAAGVRVTIITLTADPAADLCRADGHLTSNNSGVLCFARSLEYFNKL